jgi:hypothetical protein
MGSPVANGRLEPSLMAGSTYVNLGKGKDDVMEHESQHDLKHVETLTTVTERKHQ